MKTGSLAPPALRHRALVHQLGKNIICSRTKISVKMRCLN
jgi:hypothetical protein